MSSSHWHDLVIWWRTAHWLTECSLKPSCPCTFITNFTLSQKLGFASCERQVGATEGIDVLIEKKNLDGTWAYGLSCIEYTEFEKFGITNGRPSPKK